MTLTEVTERRCTKCGMVKPLAEFDKGKKGLYGRQSVCKTCKHEYYIQHLDEGSNSKLLISVCSLLEKQCGHCGKVKPFSEFNKASNKPDGYQYQCRECEREYHVEHLEQISARMAIYTEEHREELNAKNAEYYAAHREERRIKDAEYRAKNRVEHAEELKEYYANYAKEHKESISGYIRKYRHTEKGKNSMAARAHRRRVKGGPKISVDIIAELKAEYGGYCPYCNQKIEDGHIDHIVPIVSGGKNDRENLVYCCATCNKSKGSKSLLEFMIYKAVSARC